MVTSGINAPVGDSVYGTEWNFVFGG
jgi:hypothetical protein